MSVPQVMALVQYKMEKQFEVQAVYTTLFYSLTALLMNHV